MKRLHLVYKATLVRLLSHPITIRQNHPSISDRPIGISKNHSCDNVGHLGGRQNGVTYFNNHECFSFQLIKNVIC